MDKWAVMGSPITHSLSPRLHHYFARVTGIPLQYETREVKPAELPAALHQLQAAGFRGCHLTAPLKAFAMALCEPSPAAQLAGSVNCITFDTNRWCGENYDGIGLITDLINHGLTLRDKHIAILGAGGAVRGILAPLLATQPTRVVLINRTLQHAEQLAQLFATHGNLQVATLQQPQSAHFDLVIQATSAAHHATDIPLPFTSLSDSFCYDLNYGAAAEKFFQQARALGATHLVDGFGMLAAQAAENFQRCYGVYPPIRGLTANTL